MRRSSAPRMTSFSDPTRDAAHGERAGSEDVRREREGGGGNYIESRDADKYRLGERPLEIS